MNYFFLTLGLSKLPPKISKIIATLLALILGMLILIYFDENTLFLATLLIAIVTLRAVNKYEENGGLHHDEHINLDKFAGIGFALSVAPAIGVNFGEISLFSNGFLIQSLLSLAFFIYFEKEKHSVIGRVYRNAKGGIAIVGDDVLAGFIAGLVSSLIWQAFLKAQAFLF
ncbi:MAG: phosphatidylglycerophosphatase A [Sulfurimonas sp.]